VQIQTPILQSRPPFVNAAAAHAWNAVRRRDKVAGYPRTTQKKPAAAIRRRNLEK